MLVAKPGAHRIVAVAFALVAAVVIPSAVEPASAAAEPVLGGQLFSTGGTIQIEVMPASAGLTSQLFLLEPEPEVFIATNREVGKIVELGPFESGAELIFGIRVRGNEYRTGPAERNPDGIVHARIDFIEDGVAIVGFEDLFGGGDRDYDDNVFRFTGDLAPEPPPDPDPDPDPVPGAQPPIAAAGPDQSVPEGSTVQLDASGSSDPGAVGLVPSEETGNLPGGTALTATLTSLEPGSGSSQALTGSVSVGEGVAVPDTALAYVLDLSGSAGFTGGCGGDQNNDGRSDRILDCEIAAALELHEEVLAAGTILEVGLVTFSSGASTRDLDPTSATASLIAPDADADGNGVLDLEQTMRTLRDGGATNFAAGVAAACNLLAGSTAPSKIAVFISDGEATRGGPVTVVLPCDPPVTFSGFAIGASHSCTAGATNAKLQDITDLTGGTCINVPDVGDLPDILPGVVGSRILTATLSIDGGDPVDISNQLVPPLPVDGPVSADFVVDIPFLGPGVHEVCLTVTGSDQGGEDSVTACSLIVDIEGDLSYRWTLLNSVGPPIVLSSATAEMPTFLAIDDGTYIFELEVLSVTGLTDTDTVTVTVTNVDPVVSADSREAFAGGVTLVTASFTDEGWLDVHNATIDWGDGSGPVPVTVSANGAGWGTVFGSHIYETAGTYDVVVTVTDDDGGSSSDTIDTLTVAEPVAIWANSETVKKTLDWTGGSGTIEGLIHSNNELRITGDPKTVTGGTEYVTEITLDGDHTLVPPPVQVTPSDFPISFDVADYAPGGPVATQVGDRYLDQTASCSSGEWHLNQEILGDGVYYAPCDVHLNGSNIGGRVTLVASGSIQVNGSRPAFEPYYDGLLFLSGASGKKAVDVAASNSKFLGVIFAGSGQVSLSGSGNRFFCGILGDTVDISGSGLDVRGAACGRPSSTVADPVLVPELTLLLETDRETALPGDGIGYDLTVTNNGALLVVPGVVGLENVDDASATVQSYGYQLEYFSIADGSWIPLASAAAVADGYTPIDPLPALGGADVSFQQNPFAGVTYPSDDDAIVGTVLDAAGFATWGYQALVELDPAQVDMLLDPALVGGVRNRIDFELTPAATQVRRLFRFGTDFIEQLRALSGDITDVEITQTLPVGDPAFLDSADDPALALLAPGESATLSDGVVVPAVPTRTDGESDSAYLTRLLAADGDALASAAFARGLGGVGLLVAPQMFVVTSEQVPVVAVAKNGPAAVDAGALIEWDIQLNNRGSATASALAVNDDLDGTPLALTGVPSVLAAGEVSSLGVDYLVPADSDGAPLSNRAEATWEDANGNLYGPLGSTVTTDVATAADLAAILVDALLVDADGDGLVSPGDTIRYSAAASNSGDQALTGVAFAAPVDANAAVVAGSTTTSQGTVTNEDTIVVVDIGVLAGSSSVTITWDVVIADPFPEGGNIISTQGTVASNELADLLTDDPAVAGLADATVTTISLPIPVLDVTLSGSLAVDTDGNGVPSPGDTIRYMSQIANNGGGDATGVAASYAPDGHTALVVGSVTASSGAVVVGNSAGDTMVQVDLAVLAPSATETVTFDVIINDPFPSGVESVVVQGIVTSNELQPVASDDPSSSAEGDATSIPVFGTGGGGPGGGGPAPTFGEVSPPEGEIVTKPVDVTGTITPPDGETLDSWEAIAYPAGGDPTSGLVIGSGTGAPPAVLGSFDPTLVSNGLWTIRVEATSSGGGTSFTESDVVVEGQLKLGRYTTTFQDMSVGVGGFPLQVLRTYDTLERFELGDFGYGWSVDIADFRVATNGPLGDGGWTMFQCGGGLIFVPLCFESDSPHFVTVTWPDGLVETFDLTPAEGSTFFTGLTQAEFTGRAGATSTLSAPNNGLFFTGDGNMYGGLFGSGGIYDPNIFVLTDRFGTDYTLQVGVGLLEMEDRNGNTLTFSDSGVVSSFGPGIDFIRDAQGRITSIVGPDAATVTYSYDTAGDLAAVTDQAGNTTTLTYLANHYLEEITDPTGRPFTTFEYSTDGRLVAVIDAEGNRTQLAVDIGANQETVTDAEGRLTTISTYDDRGNLIADTRVFDGQTITQTFEYDASDQPVRWTNGAGDSWSVAYDDDQNVVSSTDGSGDTTVISYDDSGLPLTWTDPLGNATTYEYDERGNPIRIVDAAGGVDIYTYDASANLTSHTDAVGSTTQWNYDANGRMVTRTDGLGNVWAYTYDDAGRALTETDPLGNVTTWTYSSRGQVTSQSDPLANTWVWTYDALGLLASATDPAGNAKTYQYDGAGRPGVVTDPLGNTYSYTYDADGRIIEINDWAGEVWSFAYDGAGGLSGETDPLGRTTAYTYDAADRLASTTNPAGGTTTFGYTPDGMLSSIVDPVGFAQTFEYDAVNRNVRASDSLARITSFQYDAVGNLTTVGNPDGTAASYGYDAARRLTSVVDSAGATTAFAFDAAWNRVSVTDALGRVTSYGFDAARRLTTITDPLGGITTNSFDAAGRVVGSTSPEGVASTFEHDGRGLVTAVVNAMGNRTQFEYDARGRQVALTDALGNRTSYRYDPNSRLTAVTDALGGTVSLGYDGAGQLTELTDPNGNTWAATWGLLGGIESETDPLGHASSIVYDNYGRLLESVDPRGVATTYSHDIAGRLVEYSNPLRTVAFEYDAMDRLVTMADTTGTTQWTYDSVGRATGVSSPQGSVSYTYDLVGQRTSMAQPQGLVSYTYDSLGRVVSMDDWNGATTAMAYDRDGRTTGITRSNGVVTGLSYDGAGRLVGVSHADGGGVIDNFAYTLDANGNRVAAASSSGTESYALDALNRLAGVTYADGSTANYAYDAAGNRIAEALNGGAPVAYVYDAASRLAQVGSTSFTYDEAGNRLTTGDATYQWDAEGNLAAIAGPGGVATFEYDGTGLRVSTSDGVSTTDLLWDRLAGLPDIISDGSTAFVHAGGTPIAEIGGAVRSDLLGDGLGSIRYVTDSSGAVTGTADYDVYGSVRSAAGTDSAFGFTGQPYDPAGLVFLRARDLDPATGTFLSTDPIRPGADGTTGYNPYAYVAHNPTSAVDPSGLFSPGVGAVGAVADTVVVPAPPSTPTIPTDTFGRPGPMRPFRPSPGISPKTPITRPVQKPTPVRRGGGGGVLGEYATLVIVAASIAFSAYIVGEALDRAFTKVAVGLQTPAPKPKRPPRPVVEPVPGPGPAPPPPTRVDDNGDYCLEMASGAATGLPALAWGIFWSLPEADRLAPKNVADASYCINGAFGVVTAVSGSQQRTGHVDLPSMTVFSTFPGRAYDTERKILEHLYLSHGSALSPSVVYLFSIIDICGNCKSVIRQYEAAARIPVVAWSAGKFATGKDLRNWLTGGGG